MRPTSATGPAVFATSAVVQAVFDQILSAVHEGRLLPGQRISDVKLAEELGVSRTPVREALQRLRQIGIIEASASRFTRVADVSPQQTANAIVVWIALYGALVDEVVPLVPPAMVRAMRANHADFRLAVAALDMRQVATTTFTFFSHLVTLSENPTLRKAITSVAHIVRLGSLHLPDYLDFAALDRSQILLLDAVQARDSSAARNAIATLSAIKVPLPTEPEGSTATIR